MTDLERISDHPHLTPTFKHYIALRMVHHLKNSDLRNVSLLTMDAPSYRQSMIGAFNDAEQDGLIDASLKFGSGLALLLDQRFYDEVSWLAGVSTAPGNA